MFEAWSPVLHPKRPPKGRHLPIRPMSGNPDSRIQEFLLEKSGILSFEIWTSALEMSGEKVG